MSIAVDSYIKKFNEERPQFNVSKWIHDHPTVVKVGQVAGVVLGLAAIVTSIALVSTLPLPLGLGLGLGLTGGFLILRSAVSWLFLKYITCAKSDKSLHAYQEKSCEAGKLSYRGDIPVLEMTGDDPEKWGYAHGFLLGAEIYKLKKNLDLGVHTLLRLPRAAHLQNVLQAVRAKIPPAYLQEIQGVVKGYKDWATQENVSFPITEDDILLMHLIPDSKHFHPKVLEKQWKERPLHTEEDARAVACTSLLDRDDEGNVIFGRNMDWCPFGEAGGKSLVMVWKNQGVAVLGVPGMIGAVTGWNKSKLALAMNVCPGETSEVQGMPAIFFNRHVLESTKDVSAVRQFVEEEQPLGPYHLTVADSREGSCISFYQQDRKAHRRDLADRHIEVLNWEYPKCEGGYFNSQCRHELLEPYFEGAREIPQRHPTLMENALQLAPYVNSWLTMHSLVFRPAANSVKMSWDNGYAASGQWEKADMTAFF